MGAMISLGPGGLRIEPLLDGNTKAYIERKLNPAPKPIVAAPLPPIIDLATVASATRSGKVAPAAVSAGVGACAPAAYKCTKEQIAAMIPIYRWTLLCDADVVYTYFSASPAEHAKYGWTLDSPYPVGYAYKTQVRDSRPVSMLHSTHRPLYVYNPEAIHAARQKRAADIRKKTGRAPNPMPHLKAIAGKGFKREACNFYEPTAGPFSSVAVAPHAGAVNLFR